MERIVSRKDLQRQRREDLLSALRQVARLIGGLPADIPANPEALRRGLNVMTPASAGMTKRRWANVRALLAAALDLTGAKVVRRSRIAGLTPSWLALRNRIPDRYARARQSRFFAFASAQGVEPDQVNDGTVADFAESLKRTSFLERQTQIVRDVCREWNRCAQSIEGWPVTRPDGSEPKPPLCAAGVGLSAVICRRPRRLPRLSGPRRPFRRNRPRPRQSRHHPEPSLSAPPDGGRACRVGT
jgi:hypothetical protein